MTPSSCGPTKSKKLTRFLLSTHFSQHFTAESQLALTANFSKGASAPQILVVAAFPSCALWEVTRCKQLYTDQCIPQGERTVCVTVFYYPATWGMGWGGAHSVSGRGRAKGES